MEKGNYLSWRKFEDMEICQKLIAVIHKIMCHVSQSRINNDFRCYGKTVGEIMIRQNM